MSFLAKNDAAVYELAKQELERQSYNLEMIASENFASPSVIEAMGSIFTNKYAEGYPSKRYYGGCEIVDKLEQLAIDRVKELFGCKFANVQPNSGSQANQGVYQALLNPYDKILGMDLSHGGHLTHGAKVSSSGKTYQSFFYGVNLNGRIDYDRVRDIAKIVQPKLIVCGASAYPREIEFKTFRQIADEVGAYLFADIAHIAGLVAANEHQNPFPHAHAVTSTTHKTLRGPRGGFILTNDEEISKKINSAIFPGIQGGPLENIIAAKAVGFGENLKPEWKTYAKQVKINAKILADVLSKEGFDVVSGGTDNHLILLSFLNRDFSGKDADHALENAGITVNKNTVPGETRSPFVTSGIRIGSAALTSRGMKDKEFTFIAQKIAEVLNNINDANIHAKVRKEVKELSSNFIIYDKPTY
ncbi:MAG: serine hydroxymethyltransferase [Campylobacteraceae bacterium]|jgi:glycine hydroxymethyltransferase|nr:serine hydroxymethyltransferase [Campylobacteraceae bacterium]